MCDEYPRPCCETINMAIAEYENGVEVAYQSTAVSNNPSSIKAFDLFFKALTGCAVGESGPAGSNQESSVLGTLEELRKRSELCELRCCDSAAGAIADVGVSFAKLAAAIFLRFPDVDGDFAVARYDCLQAKLDSILAQILRTVPCPSEVFCPPETECCFKSLRCEPPPKSESCFKCKPCCETYHHCKSPHPKPCPPKPCLPKPCPPKPCPPKPCPPKPCPPKPCPPKPCPPKPCDLSSSYKPCNYHGSQCYHHGRYESAW